MSKNKGFVNENEFVEYINGKTYNQLNSNIKKFCSEIFGTANNNCSFVAKKVTGNQKPDIVIFNKTIGKYVSLKMGSGNSIHQEPFDTFVDFLKKLNISDESIDTLKLFHFGDDTINDTGKIRYSSNECKNRYKDKILKLNYEINQPKFLIPLLDRILFTGNIKDANSIDYIYHGTIENGVWISKEELLNYFINNKFESKEMHFASLTYQVWGRNNNFKAKHPDRRYVMQVKWSQIENDIIEIIGDN